MYFTTYDNGSPEVARKFLISINYVKTILPHCIFEEFQERKRKILRLKV